MDTSHKNAHYTLQDYRWAFLGTPQIAVDFLEHLTQFYDCLPDLIITNPDRPTGRTQAITPTPVKLFAQHNNITIETPEDISSCEQLLQNYDFACVFAYGSILGKNILNAPTHGMVNIHPSLLPQYRGPSPITTAILDDCKQTGVSLMKLTPPMDAGPIIAQSSINILEWNKWHIHERDLAIEGAQLFHDSISLYLQGLLSPHEQDHTRASYCPKYHKVDMEVDRKSDPYVQYRTYCAFPKPFYTDPSLGRVIIEKACYNDGMLVLKQITPEGKKTRILG